MLFRAHRLRWVLAAAFAAKLALTGCGSSAGQLPPSDRALEAALYTDLTNYLRAHRKSERVSAASLSVNLRGAAPNINVQAGWARSAARVPLAPNSLWQIGSNTKAFTAVTILQLEAEHALSIEDTVGKWLPQYPAWKTITIKQLLNMTSGLATYDERPSFLAKYASAPLTEFSYAQLVAYAAGIPLTSHYAYTNTGYILAAMIVEKAAHDTYAHQITKRLIVPLRLHDTFYRTGIYPQAVITRMPGGYFADPTLKAFAPLLYKDVDRLTLSWAQSAGGIVASTQDLTKWSRALYEGRLLAPAQQTELGSIVSFKTGLPIATTTAGDPRGYGLGIVKITARPLGTFWYYEGGTFGYRVYHLYLPGSGAIFAVGLNSGATTDDIGSLVLAIYGTLHRAKRI